MTLFARLEGSARLLALVKLANVALVMLWGFAVTYVFVRLLPIETFRAFLLLVAFGNFTVSAELGLTSIVYNRLRRHWLALRGEGTAQDFRAEELGVITMLLAGLTIAATIALFGAIQMRLIVTDMPLLFLLFFVTTCLNLFATLAKRTLAAVDRNLLWEAIDMARRVAAIGLLIAALAGMDLTLSVALQGLLSLIAIGAGLAMLHRRLGLRMGDWLALRVGGGHVRRHYLADFGASAALTASEVAAYNAPYFLIALATSDPRPLLFFDFLFKMSRALSALVRAMIEAALPRITAAWYRGDARRFRQLIARGTGAALLMALAIGAALMLFGVPLVAALFDGRLAIAPWMLLLLALLLLALAITCVSVYVQGALGRFRRLLRQSLPFLAGSLLSVPLASVLAGQGLPITTGFSLLLLATFAGTGALHGLALRRLMREMPQ
ncbi:hypothetical protein [Sphingobium algorifonticola]|uniref:Lipopolysaccharide biosynthesis protein n=1 Tax=Sphingobium algorifonticola TaxID=2008318 RepID=A0A437J776_9SPHN|nr:hypothetical protein [Sphingobium algorifonticola]RVT41012.1 hypothetical protein ENE74_11215 [Sphingobium algorifonticola]